MDMLKRFEPLAFALMLIGALNWGIVGLFDTNVLTEIFGTGTLTDIVYVVIGVAAISFLPRLMDDVMHMGEGPHPHGA